jgi:AbrB family looped-hinge helix DNA binding protein
MGVSAKVTSKGQITLPASVRSEFGIKPGDQVVFFRDLNGRPTFKVRHMSHAPLKPAKRWSGPPKTDEELNEGIGRAVREDLLRADRDSRPPERSE